jgi:hypothetical protein
VHGSVTLDPRIEDGAAAVQLTKQNISLHARNILSEGVPDAAAVAKESLTTAADGKAYRTRFYSLDMVLAIGYCVRSVRGTQLRRWATMSLREYLVRASSITVQRAPP